MPEEIPVVDLITEIHFKEKLEKGLKQIDAVKTLTHQKAKKMLSKWLR